MKLFILISALLFSAFYPKAQSKIFALQPSYVQYFRTTDTVRASALLTTSDGAGLISWSIDSYPGSTAPTLSTPVITADGNTVMSNITVLNPVVGVYVLRATAKSPSGTTGYLIDSLIVQPAIPIPPQRSAKSISCISGGCTITYDDNSVQKL